jgi:hypothetical protein
VSEGGWGPKFYRIGVMGRIIHLVRGNVSAKPKPPLWETEDWQNDKHSGSWARGKVMVAGVQVKGTRPSGRAPFAVEVEAVAEPVGASVDPQPILRRREDAPSRASSAAWAASSAFAHSALSPLPRAVASASTLDSTAVTPLLSAARASHPRCLPCRLLKQPRPRQTLGNLRTQPHGRLKPRNQKTTGFSMLDLDLGGEIHGSCILPLGRNGRAALLGSEQNVQSHRRTIFATVLLIHNLQLLNNSTQPIKSQNTTEIKIPTLISTIEIKFEVHGYPGGGGAAL